jgi:GTPase Era involved in 16S rRNA processing
MKTTVKDVINQLEKLNPNDTVFSIIYTKDNVKEDLEHYNYNRTENVYPYNDELAEQVLINLDCYDSIYETIYKSVRDEISYQVDQLSRKENITLEPASY